MVDIETLKRELQVIIKGAIGEDGQFSIDSKRWHRWVNEFLNLSEAERKDVQRYVGRVSKRYERRRWWAIDEIY